MILLLFFVYAGLSKSIQPNKLDQTVSFTNLKHHDHNKQFKINVTGSGIVELQPTIGTVIFSIDIRERYELDALIRANTLFYNAVDRIKTILKKNTKLDHIESLKETEKEGISETVGNHNIEGSKSADHKAYPSTAAPSKTEAPKKDDAPNRDEGKKEQPKYDEPKKDDAKETPLWQKQGIEPEFHEDYSIETGKQQISPIYDNENGQQYSVTNQLYITTKHVQLIKEIIFEGVTQGLERFDGVNYSNNQKEIDKAKDKALKLAIKDAKRKAKKIARSLNLQFHEVFNFKYLDNQNNATTDLCDPKAAEMLNQGTCIPIQSAKQYVRVDIELTVLLK